MSSFWEISSRTSFSRSTCYQSSYPFNVPDCPAKSSAPIHVLLQSGSTGQISYRQKGNEMPCLHFCLVEEIPYSYTTGLFLGSLLHRIGHLPLSCKIIYKLGSDVFFIRQLTIENAPCGLSMEWEQDGSAMGIDNPGVRATCSSNLHLLTPGTKYITWQRSTAGPAWVCGLVDQTPNSHGAAAVPQSSVQSLQQPWQAKSYLSKWG